MKTDRNVKCGWNRFTSCIQIISVLFLVQFQCVAQDSKSVHKLHPYDFSYYLYSRILKEHVHGGLVDYVGIKQNKSLLDSLVIDLETADLSSVTDQQRLAFFCNAYNILTLKSVVDAYPVTSIKDIDGVWDKRTWLVAGKKLTLNDIEHKVLRKEFHEPRIHVAVNCASIGCPPLLEVPYYPDRLDSLLTVSTRRFAASSLHNRIDTVKKLASLSAIFDWFGEDFIGKYYESGKYPGLDKKKSAALNFIVLHLSEKKDVRLSGSGFTVEYLSYDWSLNDLK